MIFEVEPVGWVRGGRSEAVDDDWGESRAAIELDAERFDLEALMGLDQFSHAEIVYLFDRVRPEQIVSGARHPRGRADWPRIGIFAQRGKNRPNRIGVTMCRIAAVSGLRLEVVGLDAIDGTPVLDIKPVLSGFLPREEVREPDWAREIMAGYWKLA
ncbi:SAM-dependent methyltransferase [Sphingomonas sp. ID1715]|uniref:SAM-dependent methyltransferase n=1 Tax=Sphingomonas sp. ID1715 TaxID=1656898 RepID=UPI001487EBFC|nr:SAM-dependent methyltransferase [Sphingomonas sp. ID1715]NNM77314.1 SAM-dependent methyltransferase [Sphingomonas sp. ID1715]